MAKFAASVIDTGGKFYKGGFFYVRYSTLLDLILTRLDLILTQLDLILTRLDLILTRLDLVLTRSDLILLG